MYENLSDKELLKILVAERPGENVSEKLLITFTSLPRVLADSSEEELLEIKGIGRKRASQLKACFELAKRLYTRQQSLSRLIKSPEDVANLLMPEMRYLQHEHFKVVILNTKNFVIDIMTVSIGSLNSSIVHPREVFKWAVKRSASGLVCVHNHPSGDPEPSREDIETTSRLVDAGNIVGIKVLDHVIIGDGRYISFKERGLM